MSYRADDYGRTISRATTRPVLLLWCEKDIAIVIIGSVGAIVGPTGMNPQYIAFAVVWFLFAVFVGQYLARIDPRLLKKFRAHRQWSPMGSALLQYVTDESTPLERACGLFGLPMPSTWLASLRKRFTR